MKISVGTSSNSKNKLKTYRLAIKLSTTENLKVLSYNLLEMVAIFGSVIGREVHDYRCT